MSCHTPFSPSFSFTSGEMVSHLVGEKGLDKKCLKVSLRKEVYFVFSCEDVCVCIKCRHLQCPEEGVGSLELLSVASGNRALQELWILLIIELSSPSCPFHKKETTKHKVSP